MILEAILGLILIFLYFFWIDNFKDKLRPPGPLRLPVIGNLHQIIATNTKLPYAAFDILSKKYGPLMSIKMGIKEAIVISSYEVMKEILTRDECSGRVLHEYLADRSFGTYRGIIFNNGESWKELRRFTIKTLKNFGFGKKHSMESVMKDEIYTILERTEKEMTKRDGKVKVELFFNFSLLNVLWTMVAGTKFSHDDPKLKHLLDLNERFMKAGTFGSDLSIAFPFLRYLFPGLTGANVFNELSSMTHQYFKEIFNEYKNRGDYKTSPESFVDVFLNKYDKEVGEENESLRSHNFTEEQFIVVMLDLFQTGTETLNGALSFGLLFMAMNPEVQEKVHKEIDRVIPFEVEVQFFHQEKLTYIQATILEILRVGNVVPIIPPRLVLHDFNYKGYEFKKGMSVIPNMHSILTSTAYFKDPECFRPERFIDANGGICKNEEVSSVFGFGKRACMGETLAQATLFMFFTSLMKRFEVSKVQDGPKLTTEPLPGFTSTPKQFDIIFKIRNC